MQVLVAFFCCSPAETFKLPKQNKTVCHSLLLLPQPLLLYWVSASPDRPVRSQTIGHNKNPQELCSRPLPRLHSVLQIKGSTTEHVDTPSAAAAAVSGGWLVGGLGLLGGWVCNQGAHMHNVSDRSSGRSSVSLHAEGTL